MKVAKRQRQQQQHNIKQSSRGLHRAYSRDNGLKLLLDPIKREKEEEKKRKKLDRERDKIRRKDRK